MGGMGTIYVARNLRVTDRSGRSPYSVVKILHPQFSEQECPEALRFIDEARVLEALEPTGLVPRVYGRSKSRPGPDTVLWFEMEYLSDFEPLRRMVGGKSRQKLPWNHAARILSNLIQSVGTMHGKGVLHRDLSPENVMVRRADGAVRLIDFGLARWSGRRYRDDQLRSPHLTQPGEHVGKPKYCAPEQWIEGLIVATEEADWYAVGTMAYEMITGAPPYPTPQEAVQKGPPRIDELTRHGLEERWARFVLTLLAPRPGARKPK